MKKMLMMAIVLMASTMTFAGDSDGLKAIMKSKDYAEAAQLVKQNLGTLADNAEKAKAYNHLFELAMNKVSNETGTITENQMAAQMGTGKVKPYDTLGLGNAICDAIENIIECNKYDQMPNAKGKVKPQFEKNIARVWAVRSHLVNIGQEEARKNNNAAVLKFWGMFTDSGADPTFAAMDKTPEKEYAGQVAFFAGRYAYDAKDMARANRYFEIAKKDPTQKQDAENFQLFAMRSNLKNHADSLAFVDQLKQMYAAEPENEVIVDAINGMYEGLDKKAQAEFLDQHLAKFPNSFTALANKGLMAVNANNAEEGAKWLRKAAEAKPDNAIVFTYLGACLSVQAANTDDATKRKDLYKQAIDAFDKAKELDPTRAQANWGYNRYQAYYGLYGADDPKTKAAEADMK
jgi:tetratricopeptide (TPR) repeat protein